MQAIEVLAQALFGYNVARLTLALFVLLHVFLRETKFFAFANVQIDLVSDMCDNRGALDVVRRYVEDELAFGNLTPAMSSRDVDL